MEGKPDGADFIGGGVKLLLEATFRRHRAALDRGTSVTGSHLQHLLGLAADILPGREGDVGRKEGGAVSRHRMRIGGLVFGMPRPAPTSSASDCQLAGNPPYGRASDGSEAQSEAHSELVIRSRLVRMASGSIESCGDASADHSAT